MANAQAFDFGDGQDIAGGGGHEDGVGSFEIGGKQVAFADCDAIDVDRIEQYFAGDARETPGIEGGRYDFIAEDGEEVGGGAFADPTLFVEEDDFVEAAIVGFFVPGEIVGPGGDLGPTEFVGAVAGVGLDGEADRIAPVAETGGEGDDFELPGLAGRFKQTAVVADNGDPESAVECFVCLNEALEPVEQAGGRFRQRHTHPLSIADHAGPMAIPLKQHPFRDAQRAEDAPPVQESDLPGEQAGLGGFPDRVVVEQEAMHTPILQAAKGQVTWRDMRVEIAGAGIIGLSIAWRLAQAGYQVVVRDAGRVAGESSWAGAGMLTPAGEFREDSRWTQVAVQSLAEYGEFVEELTLTSGVPIDFRVCGTMELAFNEVEKEALDRPRPDGIYMEELTVSGARYFAPIPTSGVRAARWFPNEAVVDPRHVCEALVAACGKLGVEIRENDRVEACAGPMVIASGAWASQIAGLNGAPRAFPVKGHLLGYHCKKESLPPIVRHGHHYALQRENGFTIFGSDEKRDVWDKEVEPERVAALQEAAVKLLPRLLDREPDLVWAGLRPGSEIGEPVVEKVEGRDLWLAYGHFRNGILMANTTARMITESVVATLGKG